MMSETPEEISGLLQAWRQGDQNAFERLIPLVDRELRRIARRYLESRRPGAALQTTSLLNETYVHLIGAKTPACDDRVHFFALCASIIRGILVDHTRARAAAKRGRGIEPLPLEEAHRLMVSLLPSRRSPSAEGLAATRPAGSDSRLHQVEIEDLRLPALVAWINGSEVKVPVQ